MHPFSRMKSLIVLASIATLFALSGIQSASAAVYYFSFDSTVVSNMTTINGPVRGSITLPDGDGTFLPTVVLITEHPAGLNGTINAGLTPTTWSTRVGAGFTVSGGQIVAAQWLAEEPGALDSYNQLRFNFGGFNLLTFNGDTSGTYVANNSGFSGVTYSSSPIPEPSAALLGALGALCLLRRRRA